MIPGGAYHTDPLGMPTWFPNCSLWIDAEIGSGGTAFKDKSRHNHAITTVGNTVASSTKKWLGQTSGYFDGSGDYLSIPTSSAFELGTGDFTLIGAFATTSASITQTLLSRDWNLGVNYGNFGVFIELGKLVFTCNPNAGNATGRVTLTSTTTVNTGAVIRWMVARSGTSWKMMLEGTQEASATSSVGFRSASAPLYVGCALSFGAPAYFFNGYIDDTVIIKGQALETGSYTLPDLYAFYRK